MSEAHWVSTLSAMATGLVLVAACAGWGALVARWARVEADGGLRLAWGMAVLLFLAGCLVAARLAVAPMLVALQIVGLGLFGRSLSKTRPRLSPVVAVVAGLLLIKLALAAHTVALQPADDFLGYQPLITQVLEVGHLEAPYSMRRLAAYGGQILLQAMAVPSGDFNALITTDSGLGPIFLFALGWSFLVRVGPPRPLSVAVVAMLALGTVTRLNSASQATSLVCFLALVRTLLLLVDGGCRWRLWVVYGLAAAAAASLRHLNLPFPALLALFLLPTLATRWGWGKAALGLGLGAGAGLVFLSPWMVALYASSGTPLYPLFKGFYQSPLDFTVPTGGVGQVIGMIVETLVAPHIVKLLVFVPFAWMVRQEPALRAVQLAALAGAALIMAAFPSTTALHMARYIQPTLAAAFVPVVVGFFAHDLIRSALVRKAVALVLAFAVVQSFRPDVARLAGWSEPAYFRPLTLARLEAYARAQAAMAPGASGLVFVSTPFAFDFARNRIFNADLPGWVSPPPGMPFFRGAAAVADYLRDQGIRYVVFEDFDTAIVQTLRPDGIEANDEELWQPWKPYLYDFRANLRELARTHPARHDPVGVILVDLAAEPAP